MRKRTHAAVVDISDGISGKQRTAGTDVLKLRHILSMDAERQQREPRGEEKGKEASFDHVQCDGDGDFRLFRQSIPVRKSFPLIAECTSRLPSSPSARDSQL